ncbi:unnamed protein product, partial [marine sediment metagenome]
TVTDPYKIKKKIPNETKISVKGYFLLTRLYIVIKNPEIARIAIGKRILVVYAIYNETANAAIKERNANTFAFFIEIVPLINGRSLISLEDLSIL